MRDEVHFRIQAESSSGLLCRLLGLFAQHALPAPALRVDIAGSSMSIEARLENFSDRLVPVVANKMRGFAGVRSVAINDSTA